jgi:hypothetical protein
MIDEAIEQYGVTNPESKNISTLSKPYFPAAIAIDRSSKSYRTRPMRSSKLPRRKKSVAAKSMRE